MKRKLLVLALALTMCFGLTMTANAAMGNTNTPVEGKSETQTATVSKFKVNYTQKDLDTIKKIFDASFYAKTYPDVAKVYGNAKESLWNHYVTYGMKEGRQICPSFNVFAYISSYPDLRSAFGDDLVEYYVHYADYGVNEGRQLTTLDAATKAGVTVNGMYGQVIARPVQKQVPNPTSSAVPSSVPETSKASETPKATATKTETPAVSPKPSESPSPSISPSPSDPPLTCGHEKYKYVSNDYDHAKVCEYCGKSFEVETHKLTYIQEESGNFHTSVCSVCGYQGEQTSCVKNNDTWTTDSTSHWHECIECHGKFDEAQHNWQNGICIVCNKECSHSWADDSTKCAICGKECEHVYTYTFNKDNATHEVECSLCHSPVLVKTEACSTDASDYEMDDDSHWKVCQYCRGTFAKGNHECKLVDEKYKCTTCNYEPELD